MTQNTVGEWLSITELADELSIPKQTIYRWRHEGKGPRAHKIGQHVRFSRQSVDEWIAEQLEPQPAG